jgi:hypothetical protein
MNSKTYKQSADVEKEKSRLLSLVHEDIQRRNQETTFFRNTDLKTYTEAAVGQFVGYRAKPEWKKDYQYNLFDPITRDKVMAIISKSAGLYEAQFFNSNKRLAKHSELITTILDAFYRDSNKQLNDREKNKMSMLAALITPKSIWYEGWKFQKRTIREIEERDEYGEILKTKEKKVIHYNGPWGELVPVEDFVPGSLKIRNMQEQPRVSWVTKMSKNEFDRFYPVSKYPEAAKVQSYGSLIEDGLTEFTVRNDIKEKEVEIIKVFEKWDDKYSCMANGVLLSKPNTPMPFAHKDYPFAWSGFEELYPWFVYDMPLSIKLMDMQDMNNEILNLTLDMVWRALNEVILVQDGDGINEDVLYGGGMVGVNDPKNFQKLDFGSSFAFQSASQMIDRAKRSIEGSSLDAPASGQSGSRNATAREVLVAREAAMEITTLFLQNMESMEKAKAELRVKNQLDRYKNPIDWEKRIGKDLTEEAVAMFREISVKDGRLTNGKKGRVNINITEEPRPAGELDNLNIENDKELSQTIDVSPEFIRDITFDVEIVANSSMRRSKAQEVGEARAFLSDAATMPNVFNVKYAAEDYVKKLGKRVDEALVQEKETNPMEEMINKMRGPGEGQEVPQGIAGVEQDSIADLLNQSI